jgi:hypothetical protein
MPQKLKAKKAADYGYWILPLGHCLNVGAVCSGHLKSYAAGSISSW